MEEILKSLAASIHSRWKGGTPNDFADIAAAEMKRTAAAMAMAELPLLEWLAAAGGRPPANQSGNSADPAAITVHRDHLFRIEIIQRMRAATITHHHVTTGAFAPISGERFNVQYSLLRSQPITDGISEVELKPSSISYLLPGDVLPIHHGEDFIHNLFFVDDQCLTLSIRMNEWGGPLKVQNFVGRNFSYEPEKNALDVARRVSTLENLQEIDIAAHNRAVVQAVKSLPAAEALRILATCWSAGFAVPEAADELARRFGMDIGALVRSLDEDRRRTRLADLRDLYDDPVHRIVLGALWNAIDRPELRIAWDAVKQRRDTPSFPDALLDTMGVAFVTERSAPSAPYDIHPTREIEEEIKGAWTSATRDLKVIPSDSWSLRPLVAAG